MSLTATAAISHACLLLNVTLPGEAVDANTASYLFTELNLMMGIWAQQRGTIPTVSRETFDTTGNKGGPSNPYTIGIGGDLNTARPPNQQSLQGAGLLLTSSSPVVEISRAVLTDDAWQAIQVKELTSTLWTSVYYNPTYANNLGTINLWPVPTTGDNDLVLYLAARIAAFANLTTTYYFPDGYDEAIVTNLAVRAPMGRTPPDEVKQRAVNSLALLKRVNLPISDLPIDLFVRNHSGFYNLQTGTMGSTVA